MLFRDFSLHFLSDHLQISLLMLNEFKQINFYPPETIVKPEILWWDFEGG